MPLTSTAAPEQVTQFLDGYICRWPRDPHWQWARYYNIGWTATPVARSTTPEAIALDLIANAEFRALQLGTWLNRPDGQLITTAVEAITPPPYQEDIELLTEALQLAAKAQRNEGMGRALLTTGVTVGLTLLAAANRN
jgi:hypothetical protein